MIMGLVLALPAPAAASDGALAARPCGESVSMDWLGNWIVHYRHCTSGSDSVVVKAIINNGPDGSCVKVGPNQTRQIAAYRFPASLDRIHRC